MRRFLNSPIRVVPAIGRPVIAVAWTPFFVVMLHGAITELQSDLALMTLVLGLTGEALCVVLRLAHRTARSRPAPLSLELLRAA